MPMDGRAANDAGNAQVRASVWESVCQRRGGLERVSAVFQNPTVGSSAKGASSQLKRCKYSVLVFKNAH